MIDSDREIEDALLNVLQELRSDVFEKKIQMGVCEVRTYYPTCEESNPHEYLDEVGDFELVAYHENSGLELDPSKVQEARKGEVKIAQAMKV